MSQADFETWHLYDIELFLKDLHYYDQNALLRKIDNFPWIMMQELLETVPEIPLPATQQECTAGVEQLRESAKVLLEKWTRECGSIRAEIDRQMLFHDWTAERCEKETPLRKRASAKSDLFALKKCLRQVPTLREARHDVAQITSKDQLSFVMQDALQKLIMGQDPELKHWFYKEYLCEHAQHLKISECLRQPVDLAKSRPSNAFHLPPEVATMIFSLADLESCVTLREVCSSWYSFFKAQPESFWKQKLAKRNPWLCPGDRDLRTYADCALVFTRRIKTWTSVDDLGDIPMTQNHPIHKTVEAFELGGEERLPDSFESMMQLTDVPYKEWRSNWMEKFTTRRDGEKTIIKCDGAEITLDTPAEDRMSVRSVQQGPTSFKVFLGTYSRLLVVPVDTPHEENGLWFDSIPPLDVGGVLVSREFKIGGDESFYHVFGSKKPIKVSGPPKGSTPVAFHNGTMWWDMEEKGLIPTFTDIENNGKHYYHPKRAIIAKKGGGYFGQGSKSRGLSHLLIKHVRIGNLTIYDLSTGTATTISQPNVKGKELKLCLGHVKGKFHALYEEINNPNRADGPEHSKDIWFRVNRELSGLDMPFQVSGSCKFH